LEIAFLLRKQGVITEPALEWDGSLGPEEEHVIERLGFLLNAYTVQAWYWELVEMLRKFILTVALAAMYQGDPAQLGASLLTIFIFLVLHMLMKPYLNQGLNIFQRLALISQWFTVFGGLMFVVTELLALQNTLPDESGQTILSWLILFVNTVAISLYPLYRFFSAWSESGEIDLKSIVKENFFKCLEFFGITQLNFKSERTRQLVEELGDISSKIPDRGLAILDEVRVYCPNEALAHARARALSLSLSLPLSFCFHLSLHNLQNRC